jgi:outer membrane autotransporter protein
MKKLLIIGSLILTVAAAHAREGYYIGAEAGAGFLSRVPKKSELKRVGTTKESKAERGRFLAGIHGGYIFDIDEQVSVAPQLGFRYVQKAKFKASNLQDGSFNGEILNASHQLNVVDLLAVGTYKINSMWDFQAKVGAALVSDKVKMNQPEAEADDGSKVPVYNKSKTKKSVRPEVGIGFGYLFHENMRLSLDVSHVFGNKSKLSTLNDATPATVLAGQNQLFENFKKVPSLTSISLSLQYMF